MIFSLLSEFLDTFRVQIGSGFHFHDLNTDFSLIERGHSELVEAKIIIE